jgi:hypothetical protein
MRRSESAATNYIFAISHRDPVAGVADPGCPLVSGLTVLALTSVEPW